MIQSPSLHHSQSFIDTLKGCSQGLLERYVLNDGSCSEINSREPLVGQLFDALEAVFSHGLSSNCMYWDFVKHSENTMRKDDKSLYFNPKADEMVTKVELDGSQCDWGGIDDKIWKGRLWLLYCVQSCSLHDALQSLCKEKSIRQAYYDTDAFLSSEDNSHRLCVLLQLLKLNFNLRNEDVLKVFSRYQDNLLLGPSADIAERIVKKKKGKKKSGRGLKDTSLQGVFEGKGEDEEEEVVSTSGQKQHVSFAQEEPVPDVVSEKLAELNGLAAGLLARQQQLQMKEAELLHSQARIEKETHEVELMKEELREYSDELAEWEKKLLAKEAVLDMRDSDLIVTEQCWQLKYTQLVIREASIKKLEDTLIKLDAKKEDNGDSTPRSEGDSLSSGITASPRITPNVKCLLSARETPTAARSLTSFGNTSMDSAVDHRNGDLIYAYHVINRIDREEQLKRQDNKCWNCRVPIKSSFAIKPRRCNYTLKIFCWECHTNQKSVIPRLAIHENLYQAKHVCNAAHALLDLYYDQAKLKLTDLHNPIGFVKSAITLRRQIARIGKILQNCESAFVQANWSYMLKDPDSCSMKDLKVLNDNPAQYIDPLKTYRNAMIEYIHSNHHILQRSTVVCSLCSDKHPFYLYDLDKAVICEGCNTAYHAYCLRASSCKAPGCSFNVDE